MALPSVKAGIASILLPTESSTSLPAFNTLVFTASGQTLSNPVFNSIKSKLSASVTYQVVLCPIGADTTSGGYSVGRGSPSSGNLTITAGQGIRVTVALADWPANYEKGLVGVYLKQGSGDFQLCHIFKPRTDKATNALVLNPPLVGKETVTLATLQATTNSLNQKSLGNRVPVGWDFAEITPTTQDVTVTADAETAVTFSPNTGPDFSALSARPFSISFSAFVNDEYTLAKSAAGDYASFTAPNSDLVQSGTFGINTAQIKLKGNQPLVMYTPADPTTGQPTEVLFLGLQLQNQTQVAMAWSKRNQTPVPFQFQAAALDALLNNNDTVYTVNVSVSS